MSMSSWLRKQPLVMRLYYTTLAQRSIAALRYRMATTTAQREQWRQRIADVLASADNADIPRVRNAGKIKGGSQIMHNGIRIRPGSYYGYPVTRMLQLNRGVHEPQEERVFREILPHIPRGAVMIELGAYWCFYSMWFHRAIEDAQCHLLEPDPYRIDCGRGNLHMNGVPADILHAYAGAYEGVADDGTRILDLDTFVRERGIRHVHLLHSDIEGAEFDMLLGAKQLLAERRISYVFISTHSEELHQDCKTHVEERGYLIVASHNLADSYSYDGLIVARSPATGGMERVPISLRTRGGAGAGA